MRSYFEMEQWLSEQPDLPNALREALLSRLSLLLEISCNRAKERGFRQGVAWERDRQRNED